MTLHSRSYRDFTDLVQMRQLLMVGTLSAILASYMHSGYLDWDTHYPPDEQENRDNLLLWERVGADSTMLQAWAIYSRHEGTFDLFVHPELYGTAQHEIVMDEYVAWAETRAHAAGQKEITPFWALDYDRVLIRLMRARGFVETPMDPAPPLFERSLDELPLVPLPTGFTVQRVRNLEDCARRAAVTHSAFRSEIDWDTYRTEYARFMGSAVYDSERDLWVRSPEGRGASACTIWFDPVNAVGLFEPVATHPDFQGRGLGKAVMAEGLRRMKAAGMRRAILGFDPENSAARALYTAMGFRVSSYFVSYRKPVAHTNG